MPAVTWPNNVPVLSKFKIEPDGTAISDARGSRRAQLITERFYRAVTSHETAPLVLFYSATPDNYMNYAYGSIVQTVVNGVTKLSTQSRSPPFGPIQSNGWQMEGAPASPVNPLGQSLSPVNPPGTDPWEYYPVYWTGHRWEHVEAEGKAGLPKEHSSYKAWAMNLVNKATDLHEKLRDNYRILGITYPDFGTDEYKDRHAQIRFVALRGEAARAA